MSAILLPRRAWIYNFVQNRKHAEDLVSIQQSQSLSSPPETSALEALQHVGRQWSQSPVALTPQHEIKRHAQIIKVVLMKSQVASSLPSVASSSPPTTTGYFRMRTFRRATLHSGRNRFESIKQMFSRVGLLIYDAHE